MNDIDNLTHTKWRCQYHIVFAPKYRRQIIYGKYKVEIGKILRYRIAFYLRLKILNIFKINKGQALIT